MKLNADQTQTAWSKLLNFTQTGRSPISTTTSMKKHFKTLIMFSQILITEILRHYSEEQLSIGSKTNWSRQNKI